MTEAEEGEPFVCQILEQYRGACAGLPFFKEIGGKQYCVLHCGDRDKWDAFSAVLKAKLDAQDFDFGGVDFPRGVDLNGFVFTSKVSFRGAHIYGDANFERTVFSGDADFYMTNFQQQSFFKSATFSGNACFDYATFVSFADFGSASFAATVSFAETTVNWPISFASASFGGAVKIRRTAFQRGASFADAIFNGPLTLDNFGVGCDSPRVSKVLDFSRATFMDQVRISAETNAWGGIQGFVSDAFMDLQYARIEKPEKILFQTIELSPCWFVNVDARKFDLRNVEWRKNPPDLDLENLKKRKILAPHRMLSITYRQLAVNAEENDRYREASEFRYKGMDVRRLERFHGLGFWKLDWWYWLASGYGERITRAAVVLLLLLASFAVGYGLAGIGNHSTAVSYAVEVATFQKPDESKNNAAVKWLTTGEIILIPAQAALLLLAIRRKFQR
jgi:hypothetical protein